MRFAGWIIAALAACSSRSADSADPDLPPRPPAPAEAARERTPLDLEWDDARGWELRVRYPDDGRTHTVPRESYLSLPRSSMADRDTLRFMLTAGRPLRDKSIIAEPDQVCAAAFAAAVADEKPDRLLLRISGGMSAATAACLDRLETPRLYLGLCPREGDTAMWACDGDAELAVLAGRRTLARRVRGLAVSFSDQVSWKHIASFTALEYLTVRGPGLGEVDSQAEVDICRRAALRALDVFDPEEFSSSLEAEPVCIFLRERYSGREIREPPPLDVRCHLRRVFLSRLSPAVRAALRPACRELTEIETVH